MIYFGLVSCKKDTMIPNRPNYRADLVGTYHATVKKSTYSMGQLASDTTYQQDITVSVNYFDRNTNSITVNGEAFSNLSKGSGKYSALNSISQFNQSEVSFYTNDSLSYYYQRGTNGGCTLYVFNAKK